MLPGARVTLLINGGKALLLTEVDISYRERFTVTGYAKETHEMELYLNREGATWVKGHHTFESEPIRAALAAKSLKKG